MPYLLGFFLLQETVDSLTKSGLNNREFIFSHKKQSQGRVQGCVINRTDKIIQSPVLLIFLFIFTVYICFLHGHKVAAKAPTISSSVSFSHAFHRQEKGLSLSCITLWELGSSINPTCTLALIFSWPGLIHLLLPQPITDKGARVRPWLTKTK